jgi:EamA domain-containing membrane protein RarD
LKLQGGKHRHGEHEGRAAAHVIVGLARALGLIATLIWSISIVSWYGTQERLLVHACLWTPIVVMIIGLGLERALRQWRFISKPVTLFLAIFVSTLITRNWMFLSEVAGIPGR